jgi:hypothetical protein
MFSMTRDGKAKAMLTDLGEVLPEARPMPFAAPARVVQA